MFDLAYKFGLSNSIGYLERVCLCRCESFNSILDQFNLGINSETAKKNQLLKNNEFDFIILCSTYPF